MPHWLPWPKQANTCYAAAAANSIRQVNIVGFSVPFLKWANVKDTVYSTHSVINVLHTLQITVGGILMLKNSDSEAPEDLIEPLKGDLKEMH